MIGTYNYVLYTNDTAFLKQNWAGYLAAMNYIYGKVTYSSGLLDVTGTRDWARWQQGYNNTEAQMMYVSYLTFDSILADAHYLQSLSYSANRSIASHMGR